ncbi:MAG: glycosyltransferase family 2 protein [Nitrospirae bacterium]|nr:glycosyltransferase family 2 protein [Nitrospirota bacterium]
MKPCLLVPAHNESALLSQTVENLTRTFNGHGISHHVLIVNDNSTDDTGLIANELGRRYPNVSTVHRHSEPGLGMALREGFARMIGDAVVICMADASDDPEDAVAYVRELEAGYDCVFGSRFVPGAVVENYPFHKLVLNRIGNKMMQIMFWSAHNDLTNAFKAYRREVIEAVQPLISKRFNITVEIPLKALIRGFKVGTVPTHWYGREADRSKFAIREMGSRYLFTLLYVWLEKHLLRGDY